MKRQLLRGITLFEDYFPGLLMLATSLLVFVQVLLRYFFSRSIIWVEEFARYGIVWFIFIGASLAVRDRAHANVDVIVRLLPAKLQKSAEIASLLISLSFTILITVTGILMVSRISAIGNVTPTLRIPMSIPYFGIPLGSFLMTIRYLQHLIDAIQKPAEEIASGITPESAAATGESALSIDEISAQGGESSPKEQE